MTGASGGIINRPMKFNPIAEIRKIDQTDKRYLEQVLSGYWKVTHESAAKAVSRYARNTPGRTGFVATLGEQRAGSVLLNSIKGKPWVQALWVNPEFRGNGIGQELVEACEREATRLGYREILLDTADADGYYARLGWETIGAVNRNGTDMTLMRKSLVMDAKTVIDRILEDYDPDLDPISPESVSTEAGKDKGFRLWYGEGSWEDGGVYVSVSHGEFSFVRLLPSYGEDDGSVGIYTTYGDIPTSDSELKSWIGSLYMQEEEDELARMSYIDKMVSAFDQNANEFSGSTCTKEEFEEEYGVQPT